MRILILLRGALVALIALFGVGLQSAKADSGNITLTIYKGGWIIGASAGGGTLTFRGRSYRLGVGGIDYVLVFGGSKTVLHGPCETSNARQTLTASTPRQARGLRSAAVSARSCSPTRMAPFWSSRAGRSG